LTFLTFHGVFHKTDLMDGVCRC